MSRFPNTRMAFARLFANLSICALPASEKFCIDVGFGYADMLLSRANTIKKKGQHWRVDDGCEGRDDPAERCPRHPRDCTCWQYTTSKGPSQ